jgi:hypothetical protein
LGAPDIDQFDPMYGAPPEFFHRSFINMNDFPNATVSGWNKWSTLAIVS